jgi:hypothetical protein
MNIETLEKKIIDKLKEKGVFERFSLNDVHPSPSRENLDKIFNFSLPIEIDGDDLVAISETGERIKCPNMSTSISDTGEWLSDYLPFFEVDIDQGGNVRKADEIEAIICVFVIKNIFNDEGIKKEIEELVKNYNFNELKTNSNTGENFRSLLVSLQDLQSFQINSIISACKYKIFDQKKDTRTYLIDGIPQEMDAELQELERSVKAIHYEYSNGPLSPISVKKLTKIERLEKIDERDCKINKMISNSKAGTIYRLTKLSSEYISPMKKRSIQKMVKKEVDNLIAEYGDNNSLINERSQIMSKLQRKAIQLEKISLRKIKIEEYINKRENFKFPVKQ